jgi:triosephosphate isomerase
MRKKIVAGNWKMNGDRDGAMSLANEIKGMLADEARIRLYTWRRLDICLVVQEWELQRKTAHRSLQEHSPEKFLRE